MTTLTLTRDPYDALRSPIQVHGGAEALRSIRYTLLLDNRAIREAEKDFVPRPKQPFLDRIRRIEQQCLARIRRLNFVTIRTSRTAASPTDLPTLQEVPGMPMDLFPVEQKERNGAWFLVQEAAHRAWEFFRQADRLLLIRDLQEVWRISMDTISEFASDCLKNTVGAWADLRDSFSSVDRLVKGVT